MINVYQNIGPYIIHTLTELILELPVRDNPKRATMKQMQAPVMRHSYGNQGPQLIVSLAAF